MSDNKNNLKKAAIVAVLIVYSLLTIVTCCGVWNFCPETTVKVLTGVLFLCNGGIVYYATKQFRNQ